MKRKLFLFFPFVLLLTVLFTFSMGSGIASAASHPNAGVSLVRGGAISPDTNQVPCNGRNDLFQVYSDYGAREYCYANAGSILVNLYHVNDVCTGNNTGTVAWIYGTHGPFDSDLDSRNECYFFKDGGTQVFVQIVDIVID